MSKRALESTSAPQPKAFFVDLAAYLVVMFLVRTIYVQELGFLTNGLFWSFTTLAFATWRMRARQISWADLGLCAPKSYKHAALATAVTLGLAIFLIILFQIINDQVDFGLAPDTSNEDAISKFGDLGGNWALFLMIIPFVWVQSALEELLDRGFLITWIEKTLSGGLAATVFAVVAQAAIFGFRHSNDLSERSITVGLIGLAMGVGYVLFNRNLWPLILAHCALNTMSMLDRVNS
ncbi:MAG: CPBP family intramembrane glutamic endopeptidase [Pseudomonadota bacterium]